MALFDANVAIGRMTSCRGGFDGAEPLKAEMRRLGVAEALVYHLTAAEADVVLGNRMLIEALRGQENLYPCWVMTPPALEDLPEPETWVREATAQGVRAVRMFPAHSLYTFRDWCVEPLLAACEGASLPVFVDFGRHHWSNRAIPWNEIKTVCEAHPKLNVVVVGATTGETRDAWAMAQCRPNLYLDYSEFTTPDILALAAGQAYWEYLLYGSGLPFRAAECGVAQTRRSGLSGECLAALEGNNARRILGLPLTRTSAAAELEEYEGPVIDVHAHSGAWERTITPHRSAAATLDSMDRCGIDKIVMSSFAAIHGETRRGNRQTAELIDQCIGRVYGYAVINPHYPEEVPAELEFCFREARGFVGLKLHCGLHGVRVEHPGYEEALAFASESHLPVLVHGGGQDKWESVAQKYPGASFIIAHACAWDGHDVAGRTLFGLARDVENLYVDVAGSAAHRDAMAALVALTGAGKILFGSDYPMFDLAFELGRVTLSALAMEDKAAICAGNAQRIFHRLAAT
ncbi:MAG: amidohydrolase family protein [Candidatus Hydrogenedentes bacterium]|nr:amidohydrolase family protein [Candidatus Hydrogenedentota bacterium]